MRSRYSTYKSSTPFAESFQNQFHLLYFIIRIFQFLKSGEGRSMGSFSSLSSGMLYPESSGRHGNDWIMFMIRNGDMNIFREGDGVNMNISRALSSVSC